MISFPELPPTIRSWSQTTWNEPIQNLGGNIGAWLADILFFSICLLAYAIPYCGGIWLLECITSSKKIVNTQIFSPCITYNWCLGSGSTSCALADLNFDDIYNFSSGEVIGSLFSKALLPWFNMLGATLALYYQYGR